MEICEDRKQWFRFAFMLRRRFGASFFAVYVSGNRREHLIQELTDVRQEDETENNLIPTRFKGIRAE